MTNRPISLSRALAAAAALVLCAPLGATAQTVPPVGPSQPQTPAGETTPGATPSAAPAVAAPSAPSVSDVIRPGDVLAVTVYGDASLSQTTVVQADGTIQYPLVGRVMVSGMRVADARDALTRALQKYVKHPNVSVAMQQQGQINVLVLGNVKNSGTFPMRNGARVSDAIAAAGGVASVNGEYPVAHVSQLDGSFANTDLQKLLHDNDATQNLELSDHAIVNVAGAETIRVQVLGAVSRPGNVEVNVGDRLSMALARAGAEASVRPDFNKVYLTRVDPATAKTTSYEVNVYQALEHGEQRYDPVLRKDDKIYVPEARSVSAGMIAVLGALGRLIGL